MRLLWIVTCLVMLALSGAGAQATPWDKVQAHYFTETTPLHSVQDVRALPSSAWTPFDPAQPPRQEPYSKVWLRLQLHNPDSAPQNWVLEWRNLRIPDVRVYLGGNDQPVQHTGFAAPPQDKPLQHRFFAQPVAVQPGGEQTVYVRLALLTRTDLSLVLWERADFDRYQLADHALQVGYFGLALGLIVFNVLLGLALRDRLYAFYVGFVVCMVTNVACTSGLGRLYVWPQAVWWNQFGNVVAGLCATYCLGEFLLRLLSLETLAPRMAQLLRWNQRLQLLGLATLALGGEGMYRAVLLLPAVSVLVALVVTVHGSYRRIPGTSLVLLAFLALMAGTVLNISWTFGLVPDMAMSRYGVQIGSSLEMLLLSLSLADRFVRLHKAKLAAESTARQAQEDALRSERARVDALRESERALESRVALRTAELEQALTRLQQTQDDLIQAEKLSALGAMVAGVSHELNTPLGVVVTAATTLHEHARTLDQAFASGQLTRSHAHHALHNMAEGAELIHQAAQRAAALVQSFKQVAVDQVSERQRHFDLRQVVEENLLALRASLKCEPWPVINDIPAELHCNSFPGPLGQVLSNLVMNAIYHGFSNRALGTVHIGARSTGTQVELWVQDDGLGMDARTVARVFEPFFTTRLGQGGSGLGLSVSHRIATTLLQGDLRVESSPGQGSTFTLVFARHTTLGSE